MLGAMGCSWLLPLLNGREEIDHCVVYGTGKDEPERCREKEGIKKWNEKRH